MRLTTLRRHWHEFGRRDPFWAVLTDPGKADRGWSAEAFYATGERDVEALVARLRGLGFAGPFRQALDFGCGAGRLTRALASHAGRAVGVDIAASMLEVARAHVDLPNCEFVLNETADLGRFGDGTFDLAVTRLVLQHMRPRFIRKYLGELVRVLAPGGALVFQLPVPIPEPPVHGGGIKMYLPMVVIVAVRRIRAYRRRPFPRMEVHGLSREEVSAIVARAGGRIVSVLQDHGVTDRESFEYVVTRT